MSKKPFEGCCLDKKTGRYDGWAFWGDSIGDDPDFDRAVKKFSKKNRRPAKEGRRLLPRAFVVEGGPGSGHHGHQGLKGVWGGSSSDGSSGASSSGKSAAGSSRKKKSVKQAVHLEVEPGKSTFLAHRDSEGNWTKERQKLHKKIRDKLFEGKTPVENPVSYLMGGGTAAGKSTLIKSGFVSFPENSVVINPDDIKEMIPEYINSKDLRKASWVHEESSWLSKKFVEEASKAGYNVVLDATGDGSGASIAARLARLSGKGQPIIGIFATVPVEVAIERSIARAERTGRYVPESVIRTVHKAVSLVFVDMVKSGKIKEVSLYDTSSSPKLIAKGKGSTLKIIDRKKYKEFLKKGRG